MLRTLSKKLWEDGETRSDTLHNGLPIRWIACLLPDFLGLGRIVRIVKVAEEVGRRRILDAPFLKELNSLRDADVVQLLNLLGGEHGKQAEGRLEIVLDGKLDQPFQLVVGCEHGPSPEIAQGTHRSHSHCTSGPAA
jgi:hypothetical protein